MAKVVEITVEIAFKDNAKPSKAVLALALEELIRLYGLEHLPVGHPEPLSIAVSRL